MLTEGSYGTSSVYPLQAQSGGVMAHICFMFNAFQIFSHVASEPPWERSEAIRISPILQIQFTTSLLSTKHWKMCPWEIRKLE